MTISKISSWTDFKTHTYLLGLFQQTDHIYFSYPSDLLDEKPALDHQITWKGLSFSTLIWNARYCPTNTIQANPYLLMPGFWLSSKPFWIRTTFIWNWLLHIWEFYVVTTSVFSVTSVMEFLNPLRPSYAQRACGMKWH